MGTTSQHHSTWKYLLICPTLLFCAVALGLCPALALLVTGLPDEVLLVPHRPTMRAELDAACRSDPPDIDVLVSVLNGPDWQMAAASAERMGVLWESGELDANQADIALQALFDALVSDGHWWRFGWDLEEPEFSQFHAATIDAIAKFGLLALPMLSPAMLSRSPCERDAACWIALSMVKNNSVDMATLIEANIPAQIRELAVNDSIVDVRTDCSSALEQLEASMGE